MKRLKPPFHGYVKMECFAPDGSKKWEMEGENIVPDDGINFFFGNDAEATSLYVGLKGTGTPASTDTMASHGTWTEDQNYDDSTRLAYTENASTTDEGISNSGSPAVFAMNATTTIHGSFITTVATKGGTTGTLVAVKDFTGGSQAVNDGDSLSVTHTITGSSS